MRKLVAAAAFGLVLGVAGASSSGDQAPEARAYLGFSFGGERVVPRDFHYGLRLDHDPRFVDGSVPPLVQFDFTRQGLNAARVNGLNVVRQRYQLRQTEPAAVAEGGGFWASVGNFFGFGDEADAGVETRAAEEAPAADAGGDEVTEGTFLNYSAVDWGLLAVGMVGIGVAVAEISNGDESEDFGAGGPAPPPPPPPPPGPAGGALGGLAGGLGGLPGGLSGYSAPGMGTDVERDAEYRKWLDGGTGQMGDLGG